MSLFIALFVIVLVGTFAVFTVFVSLFQIYAFAVGHWKGAPFVSSSERHARVIMRLADIKIGDTVVDLGSGNGTLLIEAAKKGGRGIGIEINPFLVWYSRFRIERSGFKSAVTVQQGDLYRFPLHGAGVVFLYLLPNTIAHLRGKLLEELKPGSRVVSNGFPIPG
ncbi:MAG: hypothetical protein A3B96_02150 [Candidatus Spechtbacteria bacterium RIFCSPHIGHO2_02_FULL_43_15b]|nr:MAG: hypothetical protein A3B96_02150 [Candidatus Spechtbacteria bacterium RIFCSPHIGHO2_02_FULL_43_15b]